MLGGPRYTQPWAGLPRAAGCGRTQVPGEGSPVLGIAGAWWSPRLLLNGPSPPADPTTHPRWAGAAVWTGASFISQFYLGDGFFKNIPDTCLCIGLLIRGISVHTPSGHQAQKHLIYKQRVPRGGELAQRRQEVRCGHFSPGPTLNKAKESLRVPERAAGARGSHSTWDEDTPRPDLRPDSACSFRKSQSPLSPWTPLMPLCHRGHHHLARWTGPPVTCRKQRFGISSWKK